MDLDKAKDPLPRVMPKEGLTDQDIAAFDLRIRKFAGSGALHYAVEPIIAGVLVEMIYEKGGLSLAVTRDSRYDGDLVTPHVKTILTVPLTLMQVEKETPPPDFLSLWGIVYMEREAFADLNQQRKTLGLPVFNCLRDATEDSLRQMNPRVAAKRPLNFFCNGVRLMTGLQMQTHYELMLLLQRWGLRINRPHIRLCHAVTAVIEYCRHLQTHRGDFPYEVDGAFITLDAMAYRARMCEASPNQDWTMAYMFGAS